MLTSGICYADTRIVTGIDYLKGVNYIAGMEYYLKGTTSISDSIDLKYGLSEQYDALRSSPFSFNHGGLRLDTGVLWYLGNDIKIGYSHSQRWEIPGSNEDSLFEKHSIDSWSFRKELVF
jgi:hypothetical protein